MAEIDELIVALRADIKEFRKGMNTASGEAKKASSRMRKSFNAVRSGVNRIGGALFGLKGAIAAAGVGVLAKQSLDSADALAKTADNIGISTDLLQELRFAASQTGVAQQDLDASLQRFNRRLADAAAGSTEFKKGFDALGVTIKNGDGTLRDADKVLKDVADGVTELGSESEQSAALFKVFGDSGFRLVNLFRGGSKELDRFASQANELGLILDESVLRNAEDTNDQLDVLTRTLQAELTKAVVDLAPEIQSVVQGMIDLATHIRDVKDAAIGLGLIDAEGEEEELQRVQGQINKTIIRLDELRKASSDQNPFTMVAPGQIEALESRLESLRNKREELTGSIDDQSSAQAQAAEQAKKESAEQARLKQSLEEQQELRKEAQEIAASTEGPNKAIEEEIATLEDAKEKKIQIEGDLNKALMKKRIELAQFRRDQQEQSIEELREKNEILAEIDAEKNQAEIERNNQKIEQMKAQELSMFDARINAQSAFTKSALALESTRVKQTEKIAGTLTKLTESKNKQLFEIGKAASIAQAVINTSQGVTKALAQGGIFGPVLAASVAAAGAVEIANIKAQKLATGIDEVPGTGNADNFPAMLQPGERVVPKETNKDLKDMIKRTTEGGQGQRVININLSIENNFGDSEELARQVVEAINDGVDKGGLKLIT